MKNLLFGSLSNCDCREKSNYFCNSSKEFLKQFGFALSWDSTIDFENLCIFIMCFGISSHFSLQVLHMYFISYPNALPIQSLALFYENGWSNNTPFEIMMPLVLSGKGFGLFVVSRKV